MKFTKSFALAALAGMLALTALPQDSHAQDKDIVDIAVEAGSFNTLVAAVQAAELVDVLKSEGPFTVFAPTDEAFAKLPEGTVANLLLPENKALLTSILTYHVVPGKVLAADVVNLTSAATVNGQSVTITVDDSGVKVDAAMVVQTDIEASNGVIHVIDSVIIPTPAPTAVESSSWGEVKEAVSDK